MLTEKHRRSTRAPNKKPGRPFYITPWDAKILNYIWLWKIASTASIHESVSRPGSPYATYKVLDKLEKNHFVDCQFDYREQFHVWQLTEQGFEAMKPELGDLKEDGFLSENHRHDRLVQAFQIGEWATLQLQKAYCFTEQQMRRMSPDDYPDWVPRSFEHRADGYSKIVGATRPWVFAYEVELTPKYSQKYEGVLRFYMTASKIDQVLWLIGGPEIKDQILKAKATIRDDTSNYHVFVDKNDFVKNGWDAAITNERSQTLGTLREKYQGICGDFYREMIGSLRGNSKVTVHLDPRKVIGKTKT
jgi:hypothetical protein